MDSALPSVNAQTIWLDAASYQDNNIVDVTVWLKGFLIIAKTSDYLFSLKTNGDAKLYLSTDATKANRVIKERKF